MNFEHKNKGVCSRSVSFEMDENHIVSNVKFAGGCGGNTQGVAKLCEGRKAEDIIESIKGIQCGLKGTSCPDQLANALEEAIASI